MPEYLAPGVYVEEVDTGSKPIEGVSTSTAGMLGVTERGPANVPILITSLGEYTRWFGERLNIADFSDPASGFHCYLPHAVEGFFTNGGKRVFITRVLDEAGATRSVFELHDRGESLVAAGSAPGVTVLLRAARAGTGGGDAPIYVLNTNAAAPGSGTLTGGNPIRVGDGSSAEYRDILAAPDPATHVVLNAPLLRLHDPTDLAAPPTGISVHQINRVTAAASSAFTLAENAAAGAASIVLTAAVAADLSALAVDDLLEVGGQFSGEYRFITRVDPVVAGPPVTRRVFLDGPLALSYTAPPTTPPPTPNVIRLNPNPGGTDEIANAFIDTAANAGDRVIFLKTMSGPFTDRNDIVIIDRASNAAAGGRREARRIGSLQLLQLSTGAYGDYPVGALVQPVTRTDTSSVPTKHLSAAAPRGGTVLALDNRDLLEAGHILRIGAAPDEEYVTVRSVPAVPHRPTGYPGNVVLATALNRDHAAGESVQRQEIVLNTTRPWTFTVLDAAAGETLLAVADAGAAGTQYANNDILRVTASGQVSYHRLAANAAPLNAQPVRLAVGLSRTHAAGAAVAERGGMLAVQALDAGGWGNRLRISVEDEDPGLVTTTIVTIGGPSQMRLASAAGVEPGTILELLDPVTRAPVGGLLKVAGINRATGEITLAAALSAAQMAAETAASALVPPRHLAVRSREFRLTVSLLRQIDLAMPSRNDSVLDSEVFRHLSMDWRHSRYVQTVIGATWSPTPGTTRDDAPPPLQRPLRREDRRSEGESRYVRVRDEAASPTVRESIRLGPEALVDVLADGRRRAARHPLEGGADSIATLSDNTYIGVDDPTPENRTGLHSLRNVEEISIVACPGRTGVPIQNALINHCELMRYRFAVLDSVRPPTDSLADVQNQRQQYDTKYAALYYPWLLIPDPYPNSLARIAEYPIAPSGHVVGIYARTDIERGVHKAPANEVVRGIVGLQRKINKEQQDILNPYPVNINVIRDFRPNNRGIRVYGGRVITSDSDWKYVNVRRLLLFIEASIDRGLQWVAFEPNAEPLWARVTRSISNFLTLVWRNGGLEGTKREEAYFVKCDRTTMTQTDIDSGRLICLVGVAPVKPAEFVIVRIGLWTARSEE